MKTLQHDHDRAERACREAEQQMQQGKLMQPKRILEAALRDDPYYLPARFTLIELALREADTQRAVRESKRATRIALLHCREAGVRQGEYGSHPTGRLLLRALAMGGRAHLAAGDNDEAINAFAVVLQEDQHDRYGVCSDLIGVFMAQGRPEGVVGLYRLGYARGFDLLNVALAAVAMGNAELTFSVLVDALEQEPRARIVLQSLVLPTDPSDPDDLAAEPEVVAKRRPAWTARPVARLAVRKLLEHPVVHKTLDLVEELDHDAAMGVAETDVATTRAAMFDNLRDPKVVQSVLNSLR